MINWILFLKIGKTSITPFAQWHRGSIHVPMMTDHIRLRLTARDTPFFPYLGALVRAGEKFQTSRPSDGPRRLSSTVVYRHRRLTIVGIPLRRPSFSAHPVTACSSSVTWLVVTDAPTLRADDSEIDRCMWESWSTPKVCSPRGGVAADLRYIGFSHTDEARKGFGPQRLDLKKTQRTREGLSIWC